MQLTDLSTPEAAIMARLTIPDTAGISPQAAEALLAICFDETDHALMNDLAAKARKGGLTSEEQSLADAYSRVGSLLGILKSLARQKLKPHNRRPSKPH